MAGIIVPGYYKIRSLELAEAKEYSLSSSVRMADEVTQSVQVLTRAGVSAIKTYIDGSKQNLINKFKASSADPRVEKAIISTEGDIIYQATSTADPPWSVELIQAMESSAQSTIEVNSTKQPWLVSFQSNADWGWYLISGMPAQEVFRESRDYLRFVLLISIFSLAIVAILYFLLTRQLRQRLAAVMEHLRSYKEGNYEKRFKVSDPDEIGKLQQGINSVIDSVEMEIISRKTNEQVLSVQKSQVENTSLERAESLANLNQLIKNPLTSILGFSKLLIQETNQKKQATYLRYVENASDDLQTLVENNLLQNNEIDKNGVKDQTQKATENKAAHFQLSNELEIALIEPDVLVADYIKAVLENYSVTLHHFSSPSKAIRFIEENEIDLSIVSLTSAKLEAERMILYVRSDLPMYLRNLPIVALISDTDETSIEHLLAIGASDTLSKPFSPLELEHVVSRLTQDT